MRLLKFKTISGVDLWLNPDHITAISHVPGEDQSSVYVTGSTNPFRIQAKEGQLTWQEFSWAKELQMHDPTSNDPLAQVESLHKEF